MREKFIDSALLVALVVVCAVIVATLFFPSRRTPEVATTPAVPVAAVQDEATADPADVPLISSEGETEVPNATPQTATEPTSTPAEAEAVTEPSAAAQTETGATETTPEPTVPPLPEGAFDLGRIGFSFAGGTGACSVELEAWRHVAVSRDILAKYPCGSEITIDLAEPVAGHDSFRAVVGDTMNPSNVRTVNIYVAPDEPALQYGVAAGRLEP